MNTNQPHRIAAEPARAADSRVIEDTEPRAATAENETAAAEKSGKPEPRAVKKDT